ncbi:MULTISPECIES: DnaJ C-terminal domain-containing protein [unclassified Halomonas]|uniref:DnaJ C-terminal domain-containing protein n=1 Tax=unclassified Halomonas TaxID=2609666 RepID=UPI0006DA3465|nr:MULTISPECIES: DnaJ C-terminal domain-containing protein [unclassified Halomonas]KPQ27424.1 MAG: curved DNA-binding protein [Halomonas sp. HL-93]SBR49872.1 curved DNA-binding protein [Halomonas sp. HL-93]SNY96574.1 curved DNA-binding protein [Halomonas sp. hl-4]
MEFKDYYQVLGVEKAATAEEIKKAYRKLARKFHPDVSKESEAEQRMQEVNEAKAVLTDPEKRFAYDQLAEQYHSGEDFQPPPDWDSGFEFRGRGFEEADLGEFSDFFANLFGQGGRTGRGKRSYQMRGEDRHAKISIDLKDAFYGANRAITLQMPQVDAQGRVVSREHTLNVQIPKGIKAGQHIRLSGQGSPGVGGGSAGDLYLEIHFTPDLRYRVEGRDVYQKVSVTPWEAALGASIETLTPSGLIKLKVPTGSQTGRRLRLRGRGIPGLEPGDLYVELEVVLPPADTDKARELYQTMAQELAFDPRQRKGG